MNKITLVGNLTRDPDDIRATKAGTEICTFVIAVDRKRKDAQGNKKTDYFRICTWGKLASICHNYLSKGRKVGVFGELNLNSYETKTGETKYSLDVQADEVDFLTPKGDPIASDPTQVNMDSMQDIPTDDIPF